MQMLDILPNLSFTNISEAIDLIRPLHLDALKKKDLQSTSTIRIFLNSGRSLEGYILDTDLEKYHCLTLVENAAAIENTSVSLVNVSDIESFEFTQLSKVFQLFAGENLLEGLGEPPTKLSLKKELESLELKLEARFFQKVSVDIDLDDFLKSDNQRAHWAMAEIFKNLTQFLEHKSIDNDFVSAFNEQVEKIRIISAVDKSMALRDKYFEISIATAMGIQGAPKPNHMYDYLYGAL